VRHSAIAAIDAAGRMTGVARYAAYPGAEPTADVAVEVVDEWHRCGVGLLLTTRVIERAVANGFLLLRATTMWENVPARALMHRLGFRPWSSSNGLIELELPMIPRRTAGHTG
jgi:L-amino acid N-acyltransferase YncA